MKPIDALNIIGVIALNIIAIYDPTFRIATTIFLSLMLGFVYWIASHWHDEAKRLSSSAESTSSKQ